MPSRETQKLDELLERVSRLKAEIAKVIVGQNRVVEELLIALLCRGHALIVGVPGLAKTLIVSTFGQALDLEFKRIQFTPDLMPSDITGTEVLEEDPKTRERRFRFVKGPIFTNLLLADEINRTPPKTQSALLQAMQENTVTYNGVNYPLPQPFFALATQNPIEQEGTYPLAEAQLDRFFFEVRIHYPSVDEEREIIRRTTAGEPKEASKVLSAQEVSDLQNLVRQVPLAEHVESSAVEMIRRTRPSISNNGLSSVKEFVAWGAGPRATQCLVLAAKARAILQGRYAPSSEDLAYAAFPVLRHRLILNFKARAQNKTEEEIIGEILKSCELPRS
ncbi:MAG: MoxR family ATPase [Elusimicrobia bacterium]|nr:MoxR family ATPase [Elusimicrobiota bacterium]